MKFESCSYLVKNRLENMTCFETPHGGKTTEKKRKFKMGSNQHLLISLFGIDANKFQNMCVSDDLKVLCCYFTQKLRAHILEGLLTSEF